MATGPHFCIACGHPRERDLPFCEGCGAPVAQAGGAPAADATLPAGSSGPAGPQGWAGAGASGGAPVAADETILAGSGYGSGSGSGAWPAAASADGSLGDAATSSATTSPTGAIPVDGAGPAWLVQPAPPKRRSTTALPLVAGVVVLALLAAGGLWFWLGRSSHAEAAGAPSASSSASSPAAPAMPAQPSAGPATQEPVATPSAAAAPADVVAGPDAQECSRPGTGAWAAVAKGTRETSCEFAIVVREHYVSGGFAGKDGDVIASSPVTGKEYVMHCVGADVVRCEGGNNAQVLIYGGRLSHS